MKKLIYDFVIHDRHEFITALIRLGGSICIFLMAIRILWINFIRRKCRDDKPASPSKKKLDKIRQFCISILMLYFSFVYLRGYIDTKSNIKWHKKAWETHNYKHEIGQIHFNRIADIKKFRHYRIEHDIFSVNGIGIDVLCQPKTHSSAAVGDEGTCLPLSTDSNVEVIYVPTAQGGNEPLKVWSIP